MFTSWGWEIIYHVLSENFVRKMRNSRPFSTPEEAHHDLKRFVFTEDCTIPKDSELVEAYVVGKAIKWLLSPPKK